MIKAAKLASDATHIVLRGVRQNNLKNIDVAFPLGKMTVVTGLSGTGKSSLVFDTLHAEGQRRYVETFSAYTRQFLDLLDKPDLDAAENIRPSIAIQQSNTVKTSRSTVGTMTELCDYFKVWFNHHCACYDPETGLPVHDEHPEWIWNELQQRGIAIPLLILFPLSRPANLPWAEILPPLLQQGYSRLWRNGKLERLDQLDAAGMEDASIFVLQDRMSASLENRSRFLDSATSAQHFGKGMLELRDDAGGMIGQFSRGLHVAASGKTFRPKSPALFSFNSPIGACPRCRGFGRVIEIDYGLVIPDTSLSLEEGAIRAFHGDVYQESLQDLLRSAKKRKIRSKVAWKSLSEEERNFILEGEPDYQTGDFDRKGSWYGVKRFFEFLESNTYKMHVRVFLSKYRSYVSCPDCGGTRFQRETLNWKWRGYRLPDLYQMPIGELHTRITSESAPTGNPQVDTAREAIINRLHYLCEVGLDYLTLDRSSRTLSGGEVERVNLTACLGTRLTDTLFVLDEPSVGLHARDIDRLVRILRMLTDLGNTVVLVEHDESVMRAADHLIEIGPRPGREGGQVVFEGSLQAMMADPRSITGTYLSGTTKLPIPNTRRSVGLTSFPLWPDSNSCGHSHEGPCLHLKGARKHNIQDLHLTLPLQRLVCLTGVSGSGKSTLMNSILYQGILQQQGRMVEDAARIESLILDVPLDPILVDQSAISRTPRSNPALFVEAWEPIRKLFAATELAQAAGYTPSEFSFNSGNGRCPHCEGLGYEKVEMQFLSDVFVKCEVCEGKRFKKEILEVTWQGHSIADVLEMDVSLACKVFEDHSAIKQRLEALREVGLGYLQLGQPINTLSGGESQRLKLVAYLTRMQDHAKPALLLLDEPTTGLHREDVGQLIAVLQQLVNLGHSVVVIEHQLDVMLAADWIVEIGPESGEKGGRLVAAGPPEQVAASGTITSTFLQQALHSHEGLPDQNLQAAESMGQYTARRSPQQRAEAVSVFGAREHNLRDLTVHLPHRAISVITGVSGSGKSSLAFDIIFAEGQRRFMESMSSYARQFVEQMPKPDIDDIRGLAPTVAIEQRITHGTRKSTVATITEVAQYLRLLYAKLGIQHSPVTDQPVIALPFTKVEALAIQTITDWRKSSSKSGRVYLCAPVIRGRKGHHQPLANWAKERGYSWLRCDGVLVPIASFTKLNRYQEHDVDVVVGFYDFASGNQGLQELKPLMQQAEKVGKGSFYLLDDRDRTLGTFSTSRIDPDTGMSYPELDPKHFSWNSSRGWCPTCRGYGYMHASDEDNGDGEASPMHTRGLAEGSLCPDCKGSRLNPVSRAVKLHFKDGSKRSLPELLASTPQGLLEVMGNLKLDRRGEAILTDILPQIRERLEFMDRVGIEYLTLDRDTSTLSGGEAQRIRLASQLGTNLTGVLYVLDEPSIGLHPSDNERLITSLEALRDKGNTLIVVEHDEDMMRRADHILDLGPGAGVHGGRILAQGNADEVIAFEHSLTGKYLSQGIPHPIRGSYRTLPTPFHPRRKGDPEWMVLRCANLRNLKGDNLHLPLGRLIMVCGVSGAGKSTLIRDLLMPVVGLSITENKAKVLGKDAGVAPLFPERTHRRFAGPPFDSLLHGNSIHKVIEMDQSPIGKTPRSNPATYIGIFDTIRQIFASTPEAKIKGFDAGSFSFNTAKGRCEECKGAGRVKLEMSFMPDTYVPCESCGGTRYGAEIQEVRWNGKSIVDVLNLSFEDALQFFSFHSGLTEVMRLMVETGLGYLTLGQPSPSLSGGEAQRVKLVSELTQGIQSYKDRVRGQVRQNLYVLEEPTIGLHQSDCEKLILLLHRLVDQGHTVIVIEHHIDLLAEADYIIEVGPGSGEAGGQVLYQGDLAGFLKQSESPTAPFLLSL